MLCTQNGGIKYTNVMFFYVPKELTETQLIECSKNKCSADRVFLLYEQNISTACASTEYLQDTMFRTRTTDI